ncbi:MAG: hypothetical protein GF317_20150 [Candidatus Lokiarchaeota archaeon]|nr:hypothetical protein [Candidatus Lokiarchaeota archaeon]MBD3201795.1 hypothetical protein [Candidatus Lokiarchaeota archaeon]
MSKLDEYRKIGTDLIDKLKLLTYPVAVKLIEEEEDVSSNALRPLDVFGREIPACLSYTWCRRSGFSFYLEGKDIACKPISIHHFGLEEVEDHDIVFTAWEKKASYKKNKEAEKASRESDATLNFGEFNGLVVSPLHSSIIIPDVVMIYCTPLILSHLILSATYNGDCITSHFNGMESSCKEGIIRTFTTNQCQVVAPGMGDRVLAGVQDFEMIFSIPESKLKEVNENLFLAGNKINPNPFGIPNLNASLGPLDIFGSPNEPGVWPYLRKRIKKDN